jgi:signal transduction histidine kinase
MNIFSLSGLLIIITCFSLFFLLLYFGKTKIHKIWAIFNLVVVFWGIGTFLVGRATSTESALLGWRVAFGGALFISVFFYHTVCIFGNLKRKKTLTYVYSQAIFFNIINVSTDLIFDNWHVLFNSLYYNQATFFYYLTVFNWAIVVFLGHYELIKIFRNSTGFKHVQAFYLLIGFIIGFLGGTLTLLPAFGINIYPFSNLGIPVYSLIVTYAILRYRLLDINLVVKKTAVYSLSAGLLSGIFVVLVLSMTRLISDFADISSFKISILAAVLIALIFDPLRNRVQKIVDRVFYKKTYDYYSMVRKVSRDLASLFDAEKIYNFVGNVIFSTMGLRNIYILSAAPGGNFHALFAQTYGKDEKKGKKQDASSLKNIRKDKELTKIQGDSDTIRYLMKTGDILIREEIIRMKEYSDEETLADIQRDLLPFQGEAIVPIMIDNKLEYLIILGEKLSGDIFTDEDVNLLNTISNQTAIALKNAKLYAEKISSERLASIGMVSATFAHEIRNPLTSIKTFAQLMPEKYADEEFRESFSKIANDEITRIDRLIKDLMSFASKNVMPPNDVVDLTEVLNKTIDTVKVQLQLEGKDITIEKLFQITPMNIHGDSQKLEQSFMNIINNGCQAMGERGRLSVDIKLNGQFADVKIIDTGRGIPYTEINKIFDPFFTTRSRGVGLGLAISRKIIEDHGGEVSVESVVSQGTTFTVSLPMFRK